MGNVAGTLSSCRSACVMPYNKWIEKKWLLATKIHSFQLGTLHFTSKYNPKDYIDYAAHFRHLMNKNVTLNFGAPNCNLH